MHKYTTTKSLDGVDIEITNYDAGHPPGSGFGSQHLNTTAVWCRPPGGEWIRSPHRCIITTVDIIGKLNVKDFVETFLKETGYEGSETSSGRSRTCTITELQNLQRHRAGDANKKST